jgi:ATP-dependent Zn protease
MSPREKTALHEAGHCVTAHLLGLRYGATLYQDGGGCAGIGDQSTPPTHSEFTPKEYQESYERQTLQEVMDDAIITAAGTVAVALGAYETLAFPSGADRMLLSAAARSAFKGCHPNVEQAFIALAIAQARALLSDHWQAVERVAQALNERGSLEADDVARLIAEATP